MLSKPAHIVYILVIVVLLAVLLVQRNESARGRAQLQVSQANQHQVVDVADVPSADDEEFSKNFSMFDTDAGMDSPAGPDAADRPRPRPDGRESGVDRGSRSFDSTGRLSQDMITRCVDVAADIDSDLGAKLAKLREKNETEFERQLRRSPAGRRLVAMAQLKEREPELYRSKLSELTQAVQINKVAADLREALRTNNDPGRTEALKKNLRTLLQVQFAMSIKSRGDYLCRIEEQLAHVREEIDRECSHYQSTIDARMKHLMQLPEQPAAGQPSASKAATAVPASAKSIQPH